MMPVLRSSTLPLPGTPAGQGTLQALSAASTEIGDLVLVITWQGGNALTGTTLSLRPGYTQLVNHFHDDGTADGALGIAWKIAEAAGAQNYQAFDTTHPNTDVRTALRVYQVGTFDVSALAVAAALSQPDGDVPPDPGSVTLDAAREYLVEAIGGWRLNSGSVDCIPGAPSAYANLISTVAAGWQELAVANRGISGASSENPGAFSDNVSATNNHGSVSCAVAIPGAITVRRGIIGHSVLEVPSGNMRAGLIGYSALTVPAGSLRAGVIGHSALRVPDHNFPGQISYLFHKSWARYRYQTAEPAPVVVRRGLIGHSALQVPDATRRGVIGHSALSVPFPSGGTIAVGVGMYGGSLSGAAAKETTFQRPLDITLAYTTAADVENEDWTWLTNPTALTTWGRDWVQKDSKRRLDIALSMCPWKLARSGIGRHPDDPGALLVEVAAGTHNSKFRTWAQQAMTRGAIEDGRIVYVRIGWEMNGNFMAWSAHPNEGHPEDFPEAWRQIVSSLRAEKPDVEWRFVFCPTYHMYRSTAFGSTVAARLAYFNSIYPGDGYVDLIGSDSYDSHTSPTYTDPITNSERQTIWDNYHQPALEFQNARAVEHGKRQEFGEWGLGAASDAGGLDNPIYIQELYDWVVAHNSETSGYEYVVYFEQGRHSLDTYYPNAKAVYLDTFSDLPRPGW